MSVTGIHHITLRVQDPLASRQWYEDVLGFRFMAIPVSRAMASIWRGSPAEGELLATEVGGTLLVLAPPLEGTADDDRFSEYRVGVDHLAIGVDARTDLEDLVERLRGAGAKTEGIEKDPLLSKEYVAFRDPDHVQWEWYTI